MSKFYKESNFESTQNLYNKNIIYKSDVLEISKRHSCVVDFNFGEKYLYGRVDRNYLSIEPSRIMSSFTTIPNSGNDNGKIEVMSFVAEAFFGLSRHFRRSVQIGAIRDGDPYLSNLIAYTGYKNPKRAYQRYIQSLTKAMLNMKRDKKIKITNIQEFMNFLSDFSKGISGSYPITRTGFIRSKINPIVGNGLSLEISDLSYTNDDQKINSFIESPNFEYYLNACNSYGFMVDSSAPWRLVADLDSIAMQGYASKFNYTSTDAVINFAFSKVHNEYFRNFPQFILTLYNNLSSSHIDFDSCNNRSYIIKPKQYTLEQINNLYNESYFINLYCKLRFLEEEKKHSEAKQKEIITDIINLSSAKDLLTALESFERFVSQPFDYSGKLSYIVRERQARKDT
jgi:hypothetical protein